MIRKEFDQMFKDARQNKFDILLFWSLDRFTREGLFKTIIYLQLLDSYGIVFHSYSEEYLTGGVNLVFNSSLWWMGLMIGSLSGIAAFLWGFLVQSRNAKRLGILTVQVQNPPTPEQVAAIAKLQPKLYTGGIVGIILLVISLTGMVLTHPV